MCTKTKLTEKEAVLNHVKHFLSTHIKICRRARTDSDTFVPRNCRYNKY